MPRPGRLHVAGFAANADLGFVGLDDDSADPAVIIGYKKAKRLDVRRATRLIRALMILN
ncbi:hypothetical protein [Streptomyces auratus]|uniref:hypothetical protein n=1 Tax=Streptomyces auratus TaxID=114687 RepID=UPI0014321BE6|nr:hypothetical protein [Streptomyces auratus]